jgi:hypothetical protein
MACSFTDGMVIGHGLNSVVLADLFSISFDDVSSLLTEHLFPGVNAVDSDSLCHIVSVKTHSGD